LSVVVAITQLSPIDKVANSLALGTSPVVRSLFDPEVGLAHCGFLQCYV
jgi:hypothetical protein